MSCLNKIASNCFKIFICTNPIICDVYLVYFISINNNVISMH